MIDCTENIQEARYRLQCRFEAEQLYRDWAEQHPVEAHQKSPGLFWYCFGPYFTRHGISRYQVDRAMVKKYKVEPS